MSAEDFALFDKAGKGEITEADLKIALETLHIDVSDQYLKNLMAEADQNKDGKVTPDEFKSLIGGEHRSLNADKLIAAFDLLTEGAGVVEIEQLKQFMMFRGNKLTEEEMDFMLKDCLDQTKDGKVDYKAFCQVMASK
eukprot:g2288.t1